MRVRWQRLNDGLTRELGMALPNDLKVIALKLQEIALHLLNAQVVMPG
jgi:hypothetical protein